MNRFICSVAFVMALFASCKKEDTVFNTDLALDSRFIILNAPADTTRIVVYADHQWTMENRDHVPWVTVENGAGNGTGYAIVSVPDNASDYPRAATLLFRSGSKTDTLKLGQRVAITPALAITAASVAAPAAGGTIETAINTKFPLSVINVAYAYNTGADWISGLRITEGKMSVSAAANEMAEPRSGKIYLSYTDILGTNLRDSLIVNQARP